MTPLSLEGVPNHYQVSVGHIPLQGQPPLVDAASTVTLSSSATLRQLLQEAEHTGCASGRAYGLHMVRQAVADPEDCVTSRLVCLGPPLLSAPEAPLSGSSASSPMGTLAHVSGSGHGHATD